MYRPEDGQGLPIDSKNDDGNDPSSVITVPTGAVTFMPTFGPSLTVMLDETTPTITDGYNQWEVVDRPRRLGMTRFKGRNPFKQDIAIMFDGWIQEEPQEARISLLNKMAQQPHLLAEPPLITLHGQALNKNLIWVIEGIDWSTDKVIWGISGSTPVRYRQPAVVHLLQHIDDEIIVTQASPAVVEKKGGKKIKIIGKGLTLQEIAQQEYGTPSGWHEILMANRWLQGYGPRKKISPGKLVQIPAWHGTFPHSIHVGQ